MIAHGADLETRNVTNTASGRYEVNALGNALLYNEPDIAAIIVEKIVADQRNIKLDQFSSQLFNGGDNWFRGHLRIRNLKQCAIAAKANQSWKQLW